MNRNVYIVMYHYIRELIHSRYPDIKGVNIAQFKDQINFFRYNFNIISPEQFMDAILNRSELSNKSVLLTFDDGYIDHYTSVFPILKQYGLSAVFSMPAKILREHNVLDVNKIHFLLASVDINELLVDTYKKLDYYRGNEFNYPSNHELFEKLAKPNRFDPAEVVFIKRLLQVELSERLRNMITNELFRKYIPIDEEAFSRELYMSMDQVRLMKREGMCFGYHGYDHYWMNRLEKDQLTMDIDKALDVFDGVIDKNRWICCYPYGSYSDSVIEAVKSKGSVLGIGTDVELARLDIHNPFMLPRLDTNDFPTKSENYLKYF